MFRRSMLRAVLLGLAVAALVIPATALAAKPKPGGSYGDCAGNRCTVSEIKVSADGSKVVGFHAYTKCNPVPIITFPAMRITPAGTFSFSGRVKDVIKNSIKVEVSGKFVSASVVRGTLRFSTATCNSKTLSYRALLGKGVGISG